MRLLDDLNEQQRQAATAGAGPVLIVAGPGTGKTKTLTAHIAYLLTAGHTNPAEIMALTFTAKAAREMRQRLAALLGSGAAVLPPIMTFHAFGHALLKRHGAIKTLVSKQQHDDIIRGLTKPAAFKGLHSRELSLLISRAKTMLGPPDDEPMRQLLVAYQVALAEQNLHDFDDLLCKAYDVLRYATTSRQTYTHVLVDEFQDTNELQYELLKLLTDGCNVFAIGDPNQSIYAFRGASAMMFDHFRRDFPDLQTVNLTVNYRSRPEIIELANAVFPNSPQLVPHRTAPGSVQALQTLNEYSEAAYIISEIEKGIGGSDFLHAHADEVAGQPCDYAVLYRTHRAAKTVQKAFAEAGIPYQIAGEGSPYERPAMQAMIAGLRFLHDPANNLPVVKNLKPSRVEALLADFAIADDTKICDAAAALAKRLTVEDEPHLPQFLGMLVQFGAGKIGLAASIKHLDHISESDFYDSSINAVALLTIHASKGLEFEHVFLCASEETIMPKRKQKGEGNLAEERRLFYVAVTRAKKQLTTLYTKTRMGCPAKPSCFITELSAEVLPRAIDPNMPALEKRLRKRASQRAQTSLF